MMATFRQRVLTLGRRGMEHQCDFLTFYVDGVAVGSLSGDSGWQLQNWSIPSGTHALEWRYAKDGSVSSLGDQAWVDQVQYAPAPLAGR
jgi:hypothetical protein